MKNLCLRAFVIAAFLGLIGCQSGQQQPGTGTSPPVSVPPQPSRVATLTPTKIDAIAALDGQAPYELTRNLSMLLQQESIAGLENLAIQLDHALTIQCDSSICRIKKRN